MPVEPSSNSETAKVPAIHPLRSRLILAGILAAFVVARFPLMIWEPGGQDEEFYAAPGWTILTDGIPRIPYAPSRNPDGIFYKADVALFAMPPGFFYWQAAFYAVLGPNYGSARIASGTAAMLSIVLVYVLALRLYRDDAVALWGAGLYSVSRVFFFPATFSRPDMLCITVGLAALFAMLQWQSTNQNRWLVSAGMLVGAGALTHPLALIYGIQVGIWALWGSRGWRTRWLSAAILVGSASAVLACWLPLIVAHPDLFRIQFSNNILNPAGPGLLHRIVMPFESAVYQAKLLLEHAGLPQTALLALGLLAATALDWRRRDFGARMVLVLAWTSLYLLVVCVGPHPTKGYLCLPGAFVFMCVGRSAVAGYRWISARAPLPRSAAWIGGMLLLSAMVPGSGIRSWVAHMRHASDTNYRSRSFVARMLQDLPKDANYLVDRAFVLDFAVGGRNTVLAQNSAFFQARGRPYDYLIVEPLGLEQGLPEVFGGRLWRAYGVQNEPFACYVEIYVPRDSAVGTSAGEKE